MCDVTRILGKIEAGDPAAAKDLLPLVYDELRKLAAAKMAQEKPDQTLQATALGARGVHPAGGCRQGRRTGTAEATSLPAAAEAMRRIVVEQARRKNGPQKGGDWQRVDLDERSRSARYNHRLKLLALNEAIRSSRKRAAGEGRTRQAPVFRRAHDGRSRRGSRAFLAQPPRGTGFTLVPGCYREVSDS